jgi:hypothetical protein
MKTINRIGIIISFLFCFLFSNAQNLDKIIKKHIKAHGGVENWEAVQSMKITGNFTAFSIEKPFKTIKARPGYYYSEFSLDKHDVIEAFDGKQGWTIDPWQEIDFPRKVNRAETNVFFQQSDFCTPLFHYKEDGYEMTLEGIKILEGQEVFKIKVVRPNGYSENWYLNTTTYLEFKSESQWIDFAYQLPSEAYYDDFREVNGVVLPFYIDRTFNIRNRITVIENIEFNAEIDKSIFEMKRNPEMEKLVFLEGKWAVLVYAKSWRGGWSKNDSTVSSFQFHEKNILTEHLSYENLFCYDNAISYTYNRKTQKYRMVIYSSFGSEMEIFEGEFVDGMLVFDNSHISFGEGVNKEVIQFIFSDIGKDGFKLMKKSFSEKEGSWKDREQFIYKRLAE